MASNSAPTTLELLEALRREHLRAVDALDRAIDTVCAGLNSKLAPQGCDRRVDGIDCSPQMFSHACLVCGELFRHCARHGGDRRVRETLAAHQYQVHGIEGS